MEQENRNAVITTGKLGVINFEIALYCMITGKSEKEVKLIIEEKLKILEDGLYIIDKKGWTYEGIEAP